MMETVLLCHNITEILLKVALNTITPNPLETVWGQCKYRYIIFNIYYSSEEHKLKVFNIIDIQDIINVLFSHTIFTKEDNIQI
jgi:hypothetical protein